jgi:ribosomal protein S13
MPNPSHSKPRSTTPYHDPSQEIWNLNRQLRFSLKAKLRAPRARANVGISIKRHALAGRRTKEAGPMTVTPVPDRTHAQRQAALKKANEIRSYRAKLKTDLKAGQRTPAKLILQPPPLTESMKVYTLLTATPRIGQTKALAILTAAQVAPSKTLGGLSHRQRLALVRLLGSRGTTATAYLRNAA